MFEQQIQVGDRAEVDLGAVTHMGIVTGFTASGEPVILSNTFWRGVIEEPASSYTGGRPWRVVPYPGPLPRRIVVERARRHLGRPWSLRFTCEHLVHDAWGLQPRSPQLEAVAGVAVGVLACAVLVGLLSEAA